jgi:hypothetical protein
MPPKLTQLGKKDESDFRAWYAAYAQKLRIDPNPDDLRHFYDYRGAWIAGETPDKTGHWTDRYKLPGHPTFSVESIYFKPGMKAGKWVEGKFVAPGSAAFDLDDVGAVHAPREDPDQDYTKLKVSREEYQKYVKEFHEKIIQGWQREQLVGEFKKLTGMPMPMELWTSESKEGQRDQQKVAW